MFLLLLSQVALWGYLHSTCLQSITVRPVLSKLTRMLSINGPPQTLWHREAQQLGQTQETRCVTINVFNVNWHDFILYSTFDAINKVDKRYIFGMRQSVVLSVIWLGGGIPVNFNLMYADPERANLWRNIAGNKCLLFGFISRCREKCRVGRNVKVVVWVLFSVFHEY